MIDAALIQQCADPGQTPAIVEKFIAEAGSLDPVALPVRRPLDEWRRREEAIVRAADLGLVLSDSRYKRL